MNEVTELRISLEKALSKEDNEEIIFDMLQALQRIKMTYDIIKDSGIGRTVNNVRKYKGMTAEKGGNLAKALVKEWREIYEASKLSPATVTVTATAKSSSSVATSVMECKNKSIIVSSVEKKESTVSETRAGSDDEELSFPSSQLNEGRKKVYEHLRDCLQLSLTVPVSEAIAYNIESSIHKMHPYSKDSKPYTSKARSLIFNLKKNERLRIELGDGSLPAEALVHMSTTDLATDDQRTQRAQASKADIDARRSDYYNVNRNELLKSLGLDPTKGGEFTCRKCGQNKTTHYSLQTRSADEPMTVFVTCLTCGNRWRTQ